VEVIIVEDGAFEGRTFGRRHDDDRCRLDHAAGRDRLAGKDAAAAGGKDPDLEAVIGDQAVGVERRARPFGTGQAGCRGRSATSAGAAVVAAAAGGGTCAGGAASASSSSFIPALKALIPFAKSPITRGSFPAPNKIRMMAKTTIQCIKLKEPISATPVP
jgi:hypothetical protein